MNTFSTPTTAKTAQYFFDFLPAATGSIPAPTFPFPLLYDFTLQAILYYYPNTANPGHYTTSPRDFYNFATGKIITM